MEKENIISAIADIVESLRDAENFDEFSAHAALLSVRQELSDIVGAAQVD